MRATAATAIGPVQTLLDHARRRRTGSAYRDLVQSSAAAMFSVDAGARIVVWNLEMEGLSGWFAREVRGRDVRELVQLDTDAGDAEGLLTPSALPQPHTKLQARLEAAGGERRVTLGRGSLSGGGYAFVVVDVRGEERPSLALAHGRRPRQNAQSPRRARPAPSHGAAVALLGERGTPRFRRMPL